jgi:glutaminase
MDPDTWKEVTDYITFLYNQLKSCEEGKCATYIPQLAKANPNWFGVSVVTIDNKVFEIGDVDKYPSIQSCGKPLNYALAIQEHGIEKILDLINVEPSGRSFNDSALDERHRPFNSQINAGAILTTSLIKSQYPRADRFSYILDKWSKVIGEEAGFDNTVFLSEEDSCDQNLSIVHKMISAGSYPEKFSRDQIMKSFQLYLQCCSITINTTGLARFAATLANSGVIPGTDEQFISPDIGQNVLSVMDSAGMYNYSGRWSFTIGVPAKSGVSGMIYVVIPRICGITVFSPPLDEYGNSVRGVKFFTKFAQRFRVHKFNFEEMGLHIKKKKEPLFGDLLYQLIDGCSKNDLVKVTSILETNPNIDLNIGDYDNRCPLHLGVEKASDELVFKLINSGANPLIKDSFGNSPLKYSALHKRTNVYYAFLVALIVRHQKKIYFNLMKK